MDQALEKLEALAQRLEQGNVPVNEMAERLREAQHLLKSCRDLLYAADQSVQRILNPDGAEASENQN